MEKRYEILVVLLPEVYFANLPNLLDGHYLDSLSILSLVSELEDEFDIVIPTVEIIPANFNSAEDIWAMIVRLQEEG